MAALPDFRLLRPASAADAVRLRAEHPASRYLAGGTDLLPNMRRGLVAAETIIDLGAVTELAELRSQNEILHIGAGVTLASLAAHRVVRERLPALRQAALGVAGPTHRASATLGGNLCLDTRCQYYNQSEPWRQSIDYCMKIAGDICRVATKSERCWAAFSGDVAPALLVLDAAVQVLGAEGARRLPLDEFYRDDGMAWLALAAEELLLGVEVPLTEGWSSGYEKLRVRGAIDFPLTGIAVALRREGDALADLRIACTGIASRPVLLGGLDGLRGKPLDEAAFAVIERQIKRGTQPMETTVISVAYRRRATPVLARRLLGRLWQEAA